VLDAMQHGPATHYSNAEGTGTLHPWLHENNKKFELMLTKRAKAYSSSCSQTVSRSPAISLQFIFGLCAAAEDRKNQ